MSDRKYREQTSEEFINKLCAQIRKGYGVTPFAGAGISSPSGIIMGIEFAEYLTFTVFRSLVSEEKQARLLGQSKCRLWNVRHDGWPESPKPFEVDAVRKWVADQYEYLCGKCGVAVDFDDRETNPSVTRLSPKLAANDGPALLDMQIRRPLLPSVLRGKNTVVNDQAVKDFLRAVGNEDAARGQMYRVGISADSQEGLIERAIRALHDWRATLHFLAELDMIPDGERRRAYLSQHDAGVIDSFNTHITRGRKPNLAHSMLAHLADPMRTRTVLTTNFDTLLEDAFAQLGEPLTVIPVGLHSHLPSAKTVHAQNTLVKLHGALTDTRADYTLDDLPSPTDKSRFFNYVTGGPPPKISSSPLMRNLQQQSPQYLPTHLLVVGFGGGDNRMLEMMKFVLDHSPDTRIFWICFCDADLVALSRLFSEEDYLHRIDVTVTDRVDLLLLELHQKLTSGMPRGGFSYQFSHDVPPKLWKREDPKGAQQQLSPGEGGTGGEDIARRVQQLAKAISNDTIAHREAGKLYTEEGLDELARLLGKPEQNGAVGQAGLAAAKEIPTLLLKRPWQSSNKVLVVDTKSGLMAVLRDAFKILKDQNRFSCIWMEMEDFCNAQELAHALLQIIALRRGLFQLEHAVLMPTQFDRLLKQDDLEEHNKKGGIRLGGSHAWRERFFRMARYFGIQKEKWVIFFYGRNVPGICAGWDQSPWKADQYKEFHAMLDGLAANGFLVVYAPYSTQRMMEDKKKAKATRGYEASTGFMPNYRAAPANFPADLWNADAVQEEWVDKIVEEALEKNARDSKMAKDSWFESIQVHPIPSTTHYIKTLLPYIRDEIISPIYNQNHRPEEVLKAQFLYSCSLFRRSRPTAAFLSEGVLPAFNSTNSFGMDNDWARQHQSEEWVMMFREKGFVWRKPGGNVWLYRDARLGMQSMFQKCENMPIETDGGKIKTLEKAYQLRTRTHFWIASWYARAFYTTSHSVPLIEALHHLYRSLEFSPLVKRPTETDTEQGKLLYRRQVWIRTLNGMIKLLKVGRNSLLFWLDRPAAEAMFGPDAQAKVRNTVEQTQRACIPKKLVNVARHAEKLKALFFGEWETLWSEFERYPFQSTFGSLEVDDNQAKASYSMVQLFAEKNWRKRIALGDRTHMSPAPARLTEEWINALDEHEAAKDESEVHQKLFKKLRDLGDKYGRKYLGKDHLPQLVEALSRLAYDHVRRAKLYELLSDGPADCECLPSRLESRQIWIQVITLCRTVFNLSRSIPPHLVEFEFTMRVNIGTLYALGLGRLARFTEAHRRLNESNSRLSKLPRRVDQVELAVIELRRAEVYWIEAISIGRLMDALIADLVSYPDPGCNVMEDWKTSGTANRPIRELLLWLLGVPADDRDESTDESGKAEPDEDVIGRIVLQWQGSYQLSDVRLSGRMAKKYEPLSKKELQAFAERLIKHLSRIHYARLDDAWVALEQAERMLAGRTRSSQWWGRLCTLRLKVFAEHWDEKNLAERLHKRGIKLPTHQKPAGKEEAEMLDHLANLAPVSCSTMAFRRKIDYREYLVSLLRVGLVVWPDDAYRRLRLADFFMRAWNRWFSKPSESHDIKTLICESLELVAFDSTHPERYELLLEYWKKVAAKANDFF